MGQMGSGREFYCRNVFESSYFEVQEGTMRIILKLIFRYLACEDVNYMSLNAEYLLQIDGRTQSIKRAYDNGTHTGPAFVPSSSTHFPFDMSLDPYARLLYWTCANTNAINVTRLDNGSAVGVVVKVDGEKPRNIALHPEKGCVKYCKSPFSSFFFS
jgi:hypothetical protein